MNGSCSCQSSKSRSVRLLDPQLASMSGIPGRKRPAPIPDDCDFPVKLSSPCGMCMNHLSLVAVVLHGASCILCDGHSFISNQGCVCTSRLEEGDVVLLRAHRL